MERAIDPAKVGVAEAGQPEPDAHFRVSTVPMKNGTSLSEPKKRTGCNQRLRSLVAHDTRHSREIAAIVQAVRVDWLQKWTPHKRPVIAVHPMNNDVIPTFEAHQAKIETELSALGQ